MTRRRATATNRSPAAAKPRQVVYRATVTTNTVARRRTDPRASSAARRSTVSRPLSVAPRQTKKSRVPARQAKRPTTRHSLLVAGSWLVATLLLLTSVYFLTKKVFLVTQVYCTVNQSTTPCSQSMVDTLQTMIGQPLFFNNFDQQLQALWSLQTPFSRATYAKVLPGTLYLNFDFNPAAYQLAVNGQIFTFDQAGQFTLSPTSSASALLITVDYPPLQASVNHWQLETAVAGKLNELAYYSQGARTDWQSVTLVNLNQLTIVTSQATYLLDLMDIDEDLQKMTYIQKNWLTELAHPTVDVRFQLPVIK